MRRNALSRLRLCQRGSTLVGYSSLALLVAIAAITLLARGDGGIGHGGHPRAAAAVSSSD